MNQKYEITEIAHPQYPGLYRIRALIDVRYGVKKGDLGGYVQSAENLSQEGTCWIADDAVVCENARVYEAAWITHKSHVSGQAEISGDAHVEGNAAVLENAHVTSGSVADHAVVRGNAEIKKDKRTRKSPRITGSALVYGTVVGNVIVAGGSVIGAEEKLEGGRHSAFIVFFDGEIPASGVDQQEKKSEDSRRKVKRTRVRRGDER